MNEDTNKLSKSDSEETGADSKETGKMKKVVSSTKRDANKALEYWAKDKMDKAKPIPLPSKEPEED